MNDVPLIEKTAELIRDDILVGEIKPGERLNIDGLARSFNTSKTPVREAMNMLCAERLVVYKPKLGYFVQTLTVQEFIDIYEIQEVIELNLCLKIAQAKIPLDFKQLESINHEIYRAVARNDRIGCFNLNKLFHMAMYREYRNRKMIDELKRIWNELLIHNYYMFSSKNFLGEIHMDHEKIMQAMKLSDLDMIKDAVGAHFAHGVNGVTEGFNEDGLVGLLPRENAAP